MLMRRVEGFSPKETQSSKSEMVRKYSLEGTTMRGPHTRLAATEGVPSKATLLPSVWTVRPAGQARSAFPHF